MAIAVEIDGYEQLEQIGVGGMAAVYRARRTSIDKTVAIKVLFPYLATDAEFIERFQREARSAASIQHENIVNVIDFGESNGAFYIVMDYYDGHTLEALMLERPGIPTDVAVQVLLEVAIGLEAAHARDIVHRDIKPANIIFTNQGGIKIADFGLARKADAVAMTQEGKVIGTPAYMSPEQAAGRPIGAASDIFSLGVVAYELLSRRKPFEGRTYSEVLEKIQTAEPPAIAHVNPLIDADLEAIVARMLEKNESDRYPNAGALVADLEAALDRHQLARDRRRLAAYARDPQAYENSFRDKVVKESLARSADFMKSGQSRLDDAIREFRRVLFVDPDNETARKKLEKIQVKRGGINRTVAIDAMRALPGHARTITADTEVVAGPNARRGIPSWVYGVGLALAVLAGAVIWMSKSDDPSSTQRETQVPAHAGTMGSPETTLGDGSEPLEKSASADSIRASGTKPVVKQSDDVQSKRAPENKSRVQQASKPKVSPDGTLGVRGPSQAKSSAKEFQIPDPKPAAPDAGSLSVFFLGGVGEITVNGKPFQHQPPFDSVSIPAGTYRIACRMTGDDEPREVTVRIVPGSTTTIEYERGGDPVVTIEP